MSHNGYAPLEVLRAPLVKGAYGRTERDWTAAVVTSLTGWVGSASTTEELENQDSTETRLQLNLPGGARVQPEGTPPASTDRVRVAGLVYEVSGDPKPVPRRGRIHHYEAVVKRVTYAP